MTKKLKLLYAEYDTLQGDDPIVIGSLLEKRIRARHYTERTMRQIVGLLKAFSDSYENSQSGRNERYAVNFVFDRPNNDMSGPYLEVADAIEERSVSIIVWNGGSIVEVPVYNDLKVEATMADCQRSICAIRERLHLKNKDLWSALERDKIVQKVSVERKDLLDKYDLKWEDIDPANKLAPIRGLGAVVQDQLARFLNVPVTWFISKKREFKEGGLASVDCLGIVRANASEVAEQVGIDQFDSWGGIDLPLENGDAIYVSKSDKLYFSTIAAAWLIDRIRHDSEYVDKTRIKQSKRLDR